MRPRNYLCTHQLRNRSYLVDILSLLFGLGSWLSVTGFWVELPLLISHLPEGWKISSQLSVAIQAANIGPLALSMITWFKGRKHDGSEGSFSIQTRRYATYSLQIIGIIANLILAFKWNATVVISGSSHSIVLIIVMFAVGLVGCSSPVLFMPQMALFPKEHLLSYLIGEGLGGLLPSAVALIQGAKKANTLPLFSPMAYFLFLSSLMFLSLLSFSLLNNLPATKKIMINPVVTLEPDVTDDLHENLPDSIESNVQNCSQDSPHTKTSGIKIHSNSPFKAVDCAPQEDQDQIKLHTYLMRKLRSVLLIQAWICFLSSGFLPGVLTFATLPYGGLGFLLSDTLGAAIIPIGTSSAFLRNQPLNVLMTGCLAAFASLLCGYTIFAAASSPHPPLVGTKAGEVLIVMTVVLFDGMSAYIKANSARTCRLLETSISNVNGKGEGNGRGPLFWCGVVSQANGASGAILSLILVSVLGLFKSS